jgi:1-acyl-sn-glycerol-3-phosphate acyltransferase
MNSYPVLLFRSSLLMVMMMVSLVFIIGTSVVLIPFSYFVRYSYLRQWPRFVVFMAEVLCGIKYEVEGKENIPDGAVIIMSKHQSTWETLALQVIFQSPQTWVLKKELKWVPVFGFGVWLLETIAIDRKAGSSAVKQIIKEGSERLNRGISVVVFPEGTRVDPGKKGKYGIGGAVLASKSGFPVVPIAHNAGDFWKRRAIIKYPGTIQVVVGPVIESKGKKMSEINRETEEWIETKMHEISITPYEQ